MFEIDKIIFVSAILILLGIASSKLSAKFGLPVLVLFIIVGMLAGEEGFGGITFNNAIVAHGFGTIALAIILFDGGLQTPMQSIKRVWKPSAGLATIGVLVTAAITGIVAMYALGLSLAEGLLIGAIVSSTDAAAVFSIFRSAGIHLNYRLKATLEIESASNDPMAIFLTIALLEILMNDMKLGLEFLILFIKQLGIGLVVGLTIGKLAIHFINKSKLSASGLYLVTVTAFGLLSFGLASTFGGSGFLSVFITGVLLGNSNFKFKNGTLLFHDGLAWLGQIMMFVVLGLLITPSSLLDVWLEGLCIALALIFIARPIATMPILKIAGFSSKESLFVSWVGLRGSVPIILAIFPLMFGLDGAEIIFNVVFFVVLISATMQGSTMGWVAKKLNIIVPAPSVASATLEITSIDEHDVELVEYVIEVKSKIAGRTLAQANLPEGVIVAMISRGAKILTPRGSTTLTPNDHLFIVLEPESRPYVDNAFA
ncbi:potassium/proton antiporter [Pseudoalteromonas marina]|uniref:Potassium/proton antiporter n=1 Tax=Pseudoalteromonas marina TaxID=267375 RepID=A0ABT9FI07_9GAMM|nr:potassium/proton antiporter [Pseudoalteromonas marina]MDP2566422.1 potassium/proton antiporter [Pseudoalteromonas marina]